MKATAGRLITLRQMILITIALVLGIPLYWWIEGQVTFEREYLAAFVIAWAVYGFGRRGRFVEVKKVIYD